MDFPEYLNFLTSYLDPFYTSKAVTGGHDWIHVRDVVNMGPKIRTYLAFDPEEFEISAILHNTDRSELLAKENEKFGGWESHLQELLRGSPFSLYARKRIMFAVLNHSKKTLPEPQPLAVALQDADKLVRFRPAGLIAIVAHGGSMGIPAFLSENPFGFTSTREKDRTSIWLGFMGNLEWVGMLSCDAARELIDGEFLRLYLAFLRLLGREITEHVGCEDASEADIKKALGEYYDWSFEKSYNR